MKNTIKDRTTGKIRQALIEGEKAKIAAIIRKEAMDFLEKKLANGYEKSRAESQTGFIFLVTDDEIALPILERYSAELDADVVKSISKLKIGAGYTELGEMCRLAFNEFIAKKVDEGLNIVNNGERICGDRSHAIVTD
jgi:hypothetical protein